MKPEYDRNPNLPWGYWLHADGVYGKPLVDEHGGRWWTVREAFWEGRLDMPTVDYMEAELERLMAVMAAIDRRVVPISESVYDLFSTEWQFERFYSLWLYKQGLISDPQVRVAILTPEGHAVLIMLAATRPSEVRAVPIGLDAIRTMIPEECSEPERAAWLQRVEDFSERLPFRFVRRQIGDRAAIALIGDLLGDAVPISRTIWTQTFGDIESRDRFHVWLAVRLDRWETWGEVGFQRGAGALTQYLLSLYVLEPHEPERTLRSKQASIPERAFPPRPYSFTKTNFKSRPNMPPVRAVRLRDLLCERQ